MKHKNPYSKELETTLLEFAEINTQLNYRKAQNSLRNLIGNLDLTQEEQQGLELEIDNLSGMLDKLEQSVFQIAVFGMVGRGKSSVLNALIGKDIFATGALHGVTQGIDRVDWKIENKQLQRLTISESGNQNKIQLLDTPGIDEVNGEQREILACNLARKVDLILFVVSGDITQVEYQALSQLRESGKPMLLVFNKIDQYPEADRNIIYQKIRDERVKELISPSEIIMVSAAPIETKASKTLEGKVTVKRVRGKPQIETLKLKIWEVLEQEGKSLIALNSMLYANNINEQILERKLAIRENAANDLIQRGSMLKATAMALNPVTAIDLFAGAIIDVSLILALSRLYGIAMSQKGAVELLKKIALSMGGVGASELLATLGLSSVKGLLGISVPVTGGFALAPYLSVAIAQGSVAGVSSYVIGQITKTYLANGASWGENSPKIVVKNILDSLDEKSILNRIKSELKAKLY